MTTFSRPETAHLREPRNTQNEDARAGAPRRTCAPPGRSATCSLALMRV
ncbi:MAG: hypothetical protein MPK08_04970 [Alphaproteobacteria bacterium]|nr:hypothetical protein [Alphaproteobacteria bacterium]